MAGASRVDRRGLDTSIMVTFFLSLATLLAMSGRVAANPVVYSPCNFSILALIVINIPVNLAVLELVTFSYLFRRGPAIFRNGIPERLFKKMTYSAIVVSCFGGVIDLIFLIGRNDEMTFQLVAWSVALVLILVSVLLTMYFIVNVRIEYALFAGLIDIVVNAVFWAVFMRTWSRDEFIFVSITVILASIVSAIMAFELEKWLSAREDASLKEAR